MKTTNTNKELKRHFVAAIVVDALIFLEARPSVFTMEMFVHKSSIFSGHKHSRVCDYFSFIMFRPRLRKFNMFMQIQ